MHDTVSLRTLVDEARDFALRAHEGQDRELETPVPMWRHLEEVAALVREAGGSEVMEVAALLHDVLEDTKTTIKEIEGLFGPEVAQMVRDLTDEPGMENMPTNERKVLQAGRLIKKSSEVHMVKVADQVSNLRFIVRFGRPRGWSDGQCAHYVVGAKLVAEACVGAGQFLRTQFEVAHLAAVNKYLQSK